MSFWWVNHKQTFKVEFEEGYIWSPQENKNGSRNESYINLTKTAVGGTVWNKEITATQKQQLVQARIGQGLFRQNVERLEAACRITGVKDKRVLIASPISSPGRIQATKKGWMDTMVYCCRRI